MGLLKNIFIKVTGNSLAQKILEKNIYFSQYLSGIGSGSIAGQSGEKVVFDTLKKKCIPPYCIFDVGSNRGQYLKLISEYLNDKEFTVHCFEPHKESFDYLKSINKNKNVKINNTAIADDIGEKELYFNDKDSKLSCLTKRRLDHFNISLDQSETVVVDTIDNYSVQNNVDRIHLLKIDVEGYEFNALKGAVDMFKKNKIDIVSFEVGGSGIDAKIFLQDFYYFFKNYNKILYRITPSGYLYKIDRYNEMHEQFRTTNFLVLNN